MLGGEKDLLNCVFSKSAGVVMRRGEYGLWSYQNQNFRLLSMTKTRPTEEISPVRAKDPSNPIGSKHFLWVIALVPG